jgi:hypothetical protein
MCEQLARPREATWPTPPRWPLNTIMSIRTWPCAKQRLICDGTRVGLSEAVVARVVDQPAQRYAMAAVRGLVGILFERTLQDDLSIRRRSRSTGLRLS